MSLRLWSGDVPLEGLAGHLGLTIRHLHKRGKPMAETGPLAGRIADEHYASLAAAEGSRDADVAAWIAGVVAAVEPVDALVEGLRTGRITGVLWIGVLGREPTPTPGIAPDLVASVAALRLRIFLENYSTWDGEGDAPPKTWLPPDAP